MTEEYLLVKVLSTKKKKPLWYFIECSDGTSFKSDTIPDIIFKKTIEVTFGTFEIPVSQNIITEVIEEMGNFNVQEEIL